ncbi:MAG: porin [Candidatus Eisenbacteria bacterium]
MTEQMQTLQADTDKLKRLKLSGYIQARWETAENKNDSVKVEKSPAVITPANTERFSIRRGRLKLTYDSSPLSQAVVYLDGSTSGSAITMRLLEAYVTLLDPWTFDRRHQLTVGQMNVPFGYEIERSSSVRELPERSRAENILFPGERDRGIKLVSLWTPRLETVIALFNGGGINDPNFPTTDPTRGKDYLARARWSEGVFDAAVSWYGGRALTALTGPDVSTDRTRFGADVQVYYALPVVGGGSLKGELYRGRNLNVDSVKTLVASPTTANPVTLLKPGAVGAHLATEVLGWYAMWVQNLGERFQLAARWESFDPNTDLARDQFERASLAIHWFYDGYTRFTVAYDVPRTEVAAAAGSGFTDPTDNLWTVQLQHKF